MEMDPASRPHTPPPAHPRRTRWPQAGANPPAPPVTMARVGIWTGREAAALRHAMRLSIRSFAQRLSVSDRMVSVWESRGRSIRPRPFMQGVLDTALQRSDAETHVRFVLLRSASAQEEYRDVVRA